MNAPALTVPAATAVTPAAAHGWLLLAMDELRLAVPQADVRQIGLVTDLQPVAAGRRPVVGQLWREDGEPWKAYCLSGALLLRYPAPATRRVCVFLTTAGSITGLLCDRVSALASDAELTVLDLPGCMTGPRTPIRRVARYEDGIVMVADIASLADHVNNLLEPVHDTTR